MQTSPAVAAPEAGNKTAAGGVRMAPADMAPGERIPCPHKEAPSRGRHMELRTEEGGLLTRDPCRIQAEQMRLKSC